MGGGSSIADAVKKQELIKKQNERLGQAGINTENLTDAQRTQYYNGILESENQKQLDAIAQATGYHSDGTKIAPEFASMLGENGFMADQYRLGGDNFQGVDLDSRAYDKYAAEALREGPSGATQKMLEKIGLNRDMAIDNASRQAMGAQSQAMADLAARGGLSGGSRERMAMSSARDMMLGRANARRNANVQELEALANDENQRINQLQNMNSMALQNANFAQSERAAQMDANKFDITNALTEKENARNYDMDVWKQDNARIAADKQAQATRDSKPSGCFLEGSLVGMASGGSLPIENIEIGMEVEAGGKVLGVIEIMVQKNHEMFDYLGVKVTGDHAVIEGEEFKRVRDAEMATPIKTPVGEKLYNLITEDHLIMINELMFADFEETDDPSISNEMSLAILNLGLKQYELVV